MITKDRKFNSKILLFGEYSLMKGSMALSIPFEKFFGQLLFDPSSPGKQSNHYSTVYLKEYLNYLDHNGFSNEIDTILFKKDIENGLIFECNIPISYGLGSSGAIVASVYNSYAKQKSNDLYALQNLFSRMESHYHGNSSGIDPLVSYINKPILIKDTGELVTTEVPKVGEDKRSGIFLIDTKTTGETQPLVSWFFNEYKKKSFKDKFQNHTIPSTNKCIKHLLNNDTANLLTEIKRLSTLTYEVLKPMIPNNIRNEWETGLKTNEYYLKLCGSGGGGMMLGFTNDLKKSIRTFDNFATHIINN